MLIIEALKQKEYIQVIKNKLVATEKGKLLCQEVESQHLLTSAEMAAKWETYLKKIGKREGNQENFINNIKKFIFHLLENVPNDIEKLSFADYQVQKEKEAEKNIVGKCPKWGTVRKMRIYNVKHIFGKIPPFFTTLRKFQWS